MYQEAAQPLVTRKGLSSREESGVAEMTTGSPFQRMKERTHQQEPAHANTPATPAASTSQHPATLHEELQHQHRSLLALHQLARTLHQSLDIEQVMETALEELMHLFNAQAGYLVLLDEEETPVRWRTSDLPLALTEPEVVAAFADGLEGQVITQQQPVSLSLALAADDDAHDVQTTAPEQKPALLDGRSWLLIPFKFQPGMTGLLTLGHDQPHAFHAGDEPAHLDLEAITDILVTALQNAWHTTRLQDEHATHMRIMSMLVHDIRSPLMSTSASFDVLERALKEFAIEPDMQAFLLESMASGRRSLQAVVQLTNDMLDMRKLQSGRPVLDYQPILLEVLFDEVHRTLYNLAVQQKVIIRYQVSPRALKVMADEQLLRRALTNLASNGLRFSPQGSMLTLRASHTADSSAVLLVVEDMGPGVAPDDRTRIFQPFTQAEGESARGTGLGLALCREVALAHGGRIWVEDREGGGSRFCMLLPHTCAL